MKNTDCEKVLIQKMALLDGEKTDLSAEEINAHLAACESCQKEFERTENAIAMLKRQERRAPDADLWSAVEKRIIGKSESGFAVKWQPFVLVGTLLVVYKLLEMLPERDLGWILKIVPFVLVVALFGFLKENPFKINTGLILEK
jgi:predicted anti-sigma-YlaC factor YlaD